MRSITKRWLFNNLGVILAILVVIEIAFGIGVRSYYYGSVKQALDIQANTVLNVLTKADQSMGIDLDSEIRSTVENFEDKGRMELMAIGEDGKVAITSSGFHPEANIAMPDYEAAEQAESRYGEFMGVLPGGEPFMAVSVMVPDSAQYYRAMRYVVSLEMVNAQILMIVALLTLIGIAIIFFVVFTSSYFIKSIVIPVGEVGATARRIAAGDFNVRLKKKYDDEIGELCDIINYMAGELSASERIKNDFISSVSHELRTPLTAIKGWAETLEGSSPEDTSMREKGMRVISSETERLSGMVEELLDFSRMQSGRLSLAKTRMDILAELGEAVLMFTQRARREGVEFLYIEPESLSPVFGDRNRLKQVFVNIIDNALKYSDNGGRITISARESPQKEIHISISDTGSGISAEDLPKVKTKFYKGTS
ncbi:MAG: sensor histidine kinase, partial [Acetanaerobacterium sp.]